jgi:hypothetical protein
MGSTARRSTDFAVCDAAADETAKRVARLKVNEQMATTISAVRHLPALILQSLSPGISQSVVNPAAVDYTVSNIEAGKSPQ